MKPITWTLMPCSEHAAAIGEALTATPEEISHARGAKNVRSIEAPKTNWDRPGRWRCWLCRRPRWRRGTMRESHQHYLDIHFEKET